MRIAIIGRSGQLAQALAAKVPADHIGRPEIDLLTPGAVAGAIAASSADIVINASAYTAVDLAESERDAAFRINADAPAEMAEACKKAGKQFLHVSTDFVFDGSQSHPYKETDLCRPTGVYGESKLAGESAVLGAYPQASVIRTAWVYSAQGKNFLLTMLRLMAERSELGVVCDQVGTPTSADNLAGALLALAATDDTAGLWHYTDCGVASWYDFAVAIAEDARSAGLLSNMPLIRPIASIEYPTPATRPHFSVLDSSRIRAHCALAPEHWRAALRRTLQQCIERQENS